MNDLLRPCEAWAERISLAAAGCLSHDEERDVRRHVETCSDCRERFRQLTELCGALAEAQLPAESAEAAIVERVMSAVASDESRRPIVRTRAEMIHLPLLTRSLDNWRRIMRSPVSRVAAAAIFVLAVGGVAWWLHGGGATLAFADFVAPILDAKTVKYKLTTEMAGPPAVTVTSEVMVLGATRSRQEMEMPGKSKAIMIFDWGRGRSLTLEPASKKAIVLTLANLTKEQVSQQDPFAMFRSILRDAQDKPTVQREPLGEKEIDGHRVVGFRFRSKGMVTSLWGDPNTGLPVRGEVTTAMYGNMKATMSDFAFNVDMDESLFSVEPPAGYTVQNMNVDVSPAEEKDLIAAFREYSKLKGAAFPDSLDMQTTLQMVAKEVGKKLAIEMPAEKPAPGKEKPDKQQMQKSMEAGMQKTVDVQIRLQRGLLFALLLPTDADAHYAGKGVSPGAADKPIFWYRPKDARKYRVIYADLSVRDADAPPSVPNAQPVPGPSTPKN